MEQDPAKKFSQMDHCCREAVKVYNTAIERAGFESEI